MYLCVAMISASVKRLIYAHFNFVVFLVFVMMCQQLLKVKGRDIYIPPLTGKPRPAAVYNAKWRTDRQ